MYLREASLKLHAAKNTTISSSSRERNPNVRVDEDHELTRVDKSHSGGELEFIEPEIQTADTTIRTSRPLPNAENEIELIHKAKIQVDQLKDSFSALINSQREMHAKLSYDQLNFEKKHVAFNKSIRAYVDVCCNTPGLVSKINNFFLTLDRGQRVQI